MTPYTRRLVLSHLDDTAGVFNVCLSVIHFYLYIEKNTANGVWGLCSLISMSMTVYDMSLQCLDLLLLFGFSLMSTISYLLPPPRDYWSSTRQSCMHTIHTKSLPGFAVSRKKRRGACIHCFVTTEK